MRNIWIIILLIISVAAYGAVDSTEVHTLDEVVVRSDAGARKLRRYATNSELISSAELARAACCNLGESFTTNPSVDVSYSDAATGARQIRLLGLSGTYVQMLTENIPNFRGAAGAYGLGYVAGPWMQSIQVSKGTSSVKNGYESISGQINVEMKKPQADPSLALNAYVDHRGKVELNADGNLHFGPRWSGALLLHGENSFASHDDNDDGFIDMPAVRQFAGQNRWAYMSNNYVFQASVKFLAERRRSGQDEHHVPADARVYKINIDTRRVEAFTKNAYIFDRENDGNVALIVSANFHDQKADYGFKYYNVVQREAYAQAMFERKWEGLHALSTGVSYNYDNFHQWISGGAPQKLLEHEGVGGAYAQYTFNLDDRLIAMGGMRYDYSSLYGSSVTPRIHVRYTPVETLSFNASAGRGFRTPHVFAELNYLMASSRKLYIQRNLPREEAWNYGASAQWKPSFAKGVLSLAAEYFYTDFKHQLCVNFDRDPHAVYIYDLAGKSRSHTVQVEATVKILPEMTVGAAWRLTDVQADYGSGMQIKPLISKHKGLFTFNYAPQMGLWQFDASLAVNGGGRMPEPFGDFKAYCQLNAQITRNFRHWAVYIGGENLTNYRQPNPIIGADNPWGPNFDATMIYGPLHGALVYAGFRYNITKYL